MSSDSTAGPSPRAHRSGLFGRLVPLIALTVIGGSGQALAQANVSFRSGLCALPSNGQMNWGTNVGLVAKFDATRLIRLRSQIDLDRAAMLDVAMGSYHGDQTATFTSLGFGVEFETGTRDYALIAHVTPHMTIRTTSRILMDAAGRQDLSDVARFSLGTTFGAGGEVFLSNVIGLELQAQYVIFNFDHDESDPQYKGIRLDAGIQFYLGQNFKR
jgi:hypothetical protein